MHAHTGEHVYRLTARQRLILAAVLAAILIGPAAMLVAALSAHGHVPAAPGPVPVTVQPAPFPVQPAPVGETRGPQITV